MVVEALRKLHHWGVPDTMATLERCTRAIAERASEPGPRLVPAALRTGHILGLRFPDGVLSGPPDRLADTLCDEHAIGRVTEVRDRWAYSSCLCFALDLDEQRRSGFRYAYSAYQVEYGRNLLFKRGSALDGVFQGLIDRTRRHLDAATLKTLFGYKRRPHNRQWKTRLPMVRLLDQSAYDLRVFKVHFGPLTLMLNDKGARVLRVEAIAHNTKELRCGRSVEKLPIMLVQLQRMAIDFLNTVQAAHCSYLPDRVPAELITPSQSGRRRLAGIDLQKPRVQVVTEALLALAPKPSGFSVAELASKVQDLRPNTRPDYASRQASYDLAKLRGEALVERIEGTRQYRVHPRGIRVLAGLGKPRPGQPPKHIDPLDRHYTVRRAV